MNERAYSVPGLAAVNAAEVEAIRKQASAVQAVDPADKGTVSAPDGATAKSSLQKLLEAVKTHNGGNYGPALPKQAEYNTTGMFQGGVQNLPNGWDARGNGSGWQQGSPNNYLDFKPRQAPVPTKVPQTPQQIQQGAIRRATGPAGALLEGNALRPAAGDAARYGVTTPGTQVLHAPEQTTPKQASVDLASYLMYKQAADEKKRKSKEVNLAPRHFAPTPAFTQPSILGESVGLTPEQQVKANWNAYYNALGFGLGALAGAIGGGVIGGPGNAGAAGIGAVGGGLLGHYLAHKVVQSQRDLGNEADFDWKYFLPFTGAHEAVQLAGANKAQQEQAYHNAYKATLGAMGGNIASNIVSVPLTVATGNPAIGTGIGKAVSWALNPVAERAALNSMAD